MPTACELTSVPETCATTLSQLSKLDLSPLGITLTNKGALATIRSTCIDLPLVGGDAKRVEMLEPEGIALSPGALTTLHVATSTPSSRRVHPAIKTHLMSRSLPEGALYLDAAGILVTSPELTFTQVCLPTHDLPNIELLLEWSGTYALRPHGLPCLHHTQPLLQRDHLESAITHMSKTIGIPAAKRALEWLGPTMASPRETELYLLVVLSVQSGGYGFARPIANTMIPVRGTAAESLTSASHYLVDLLWPDERVVLEYDGLDDHERTPTQAAADKERRSVLAALGYRVMVVTKRDFTSSSQLDKKMNQLAMALGIPLPDCSTAERASRESLLRWLCNPQHDHLPFGNLYH